MTPRHPLFTEYDPSSWKSVNDTLRGGTSTCYLRARSPATSALFGGLLTSQPLGAGFASQALHGCWDLSAYDGLEITVLKANPQVPTVTLVLRNDLTPGETTFEAHFRTPVERRFVKWEEFVPTRRGKEREEGRLDAGNVKGVSWMVRTFFGGQEGAWEVEVGPVVAVKEAEGRRVGKCEVDKLDAEMEGAARGDAETGRGVGRDGWCEVDDLDAAMERNTQREKEAYDERRRKLRCEIDALDASMLSPGDGRGGRACCSIM